jgi:hypothetical protein
VKTTITFLYTVYAMNTSISTVHYIPFVVTMAVHPCSIFGKEENKEWGKSKGKKRR